MNNTTNAATVTQTFIGSCTCKAVTRKALELSKTVRIERTRMGERRTVSLFALPVEGVRGQRIEAGQVAVTCTCGKAVTLRRIVGTVNNVKCSAICTGAKGHVCDCSCGGKNHGAHA